MPPHWLSQHEALDERHAARAAAWLELPVKQLVQRMCSQAEGWGRAMRQNSPFTAAGLAGGR